MHLDLIHIHFQIDADLIQLHQQCIQMLRDDVLDDHLICSGRSQHDIRCRLDAIRDDLMETAHQTIHAVDGDHAGSHSADVCPHLVEHGRNVDDLRFLRRIFDRRTPFGIHCGHHDVDGRSDAGDIQKDLVADKFLRFDDIRTTFILHAGA